MKKITMVKKRLENGEPCKKCVQAEEVLKRRGVWEQIDEVIWAEEGKPESAGMLLSQKHGVDLAPFFLVEESGEVEVIVQVGMVIKKHLKKPSADPDSLSGSGSPQKEVEAGAVELSGAGPQTIMNWMLSRYGAKCAIAFSGAEDVALIDMAVNSGLPFSVFCLDTGRLHPETYRFVDRVRKHYGIEIEIFSPQAEPLQAFVKKKGLFSFYDDGHSECCGVRKVEPLRRALSKFDAWITGQRRDQSPTRADVPELAWDTSHGPEGMAKANPLAGFEQQKVWGYIRNNDVPYSELHDQGFISIGCEPCTRAIRPGEHERAGRWWWEEATKRECGLHKS